MNKDKLETIVTSLFIRVLVLCFGIALLIFLGPAIFANLVNPPAWYGTVIALYFLLNGILAIVFFFSRKVLHLLKIVPALAYLLIAVIWQLLPKS